MSHSDLCRSLMRCRLQAAASTAVQPAGAGAQPAALEEPQQAARRPSHLAGEHVARLHNRVDGGQQASERARHKCMACWRTLCSIWLELLSRMDNNFSPPTVMSLVGVSLLVGATQTLRRSLRNCKSGVNDARFVLAISTTGMSQGLRGWLPQATT